MRRFLLACILAGSAWAVHAGPVDWSFTYTGFHATYTTTHELFGTTTTEESLPGMEVAGAFHGNDDNGDGVLSLDELDAFVVGATNYLACSVNPTRWERCEVGRFSFTLADQALSFAARWQGNDEFWSGWGGGIVSGLEKVDYSYNDYSETIHTYAWTDATRLSFTQLPPPVPEPDGGVMVVAGLVVLAGLRFKRYVVGQRGSGKLGRSLISQADR